jgi:DHA2 family multidrug resistance protein
VQLGLCQFCIGRLSGSFAPYVGLPGVLLGSMMSTLDSRVTVFGLADLRGALVIGFDPTAWIACDGMKSSVAHWSVKPVASKHAQSLALTSLVVVVARSINLAEAVTVGTFMQTSRLFGGEVGIAFMQTFVRVREQIHSNLLGLHVQSQDDLSMSRLLAYSRALGTHISDASEAAVQSVKLLTNVVGRQAFVLAYIDGFQAAAAVAAIRWI